MVGSQNRLNAQQQVISPRAEVLSVLRVKRHGAIAVQQVLPHVGITIGFPRHVR
jgi:hypothetical protein